MSAPTTRRIKATSAAVAPPGRESGRRLHEVGAGRFAERGGRDLLFVSQERGLDDHLADHAALATRLDDGLDVALDGAQITGLQRPDVDHHVDFRGAIIDSPACLELLDVRGRRAERKPDNGTDPDGRAAESRGRERDPCRVHAHRREVEFRSLATQLFDLRARRVRLQQRVVDQARDTARSTASCVDADPRRSGIQSRLGVGRGSSPASPSGSCTVAATACVRPVPRAPLR